MNLYKWLTCNAGFNNDVGISIDKAKLHFYGKEIETKELIRRIDAALEKINSKTKIQASYQKIKTGKTITSLRFTIKNKYTKPVKPPKTKTPAEMERDAKNGRKLVEENIEMKRTIRRLEGRIHALENPMPEEVRKEMKEALLESMTGKNKSGRNSK